MIPALVAFAGGLAALWSLTLGQDPSNALPHWSPVSGWGLGLGSLALASVLAWIGLVRRKCPDCGSSQMLDGMEEEAAIASERLAAQREAVGAAQTELQSSHDKVMADSLATREQALRSTLEQDLRVRLVRELEPQIERNLRARLEKELHTSPGSELRPSARPFSTPQPRVETAPLSMRFSAGKDRAHKDPGEKDRGEKDRGEKDRGEK